jgi:hypothetical protein
VGILKNAGLMGGGGGEGEEGQESSSGIWKRIVELGTITAKAQCIASGYLLHDYRLQITDYRLAPSKWGAREEPTSAPWATIEDTLSS